MTGMPLSPVATRPPAADVLLSDGTVAVIRPLLAHDESDLAAVVALHDRASDESLRLRFFSAGRGTAHAYIDHLRTSESTRSLVALVSGEVIALATAEQVDDDSAEVAFLVDDRCAGKGVGSLLLEHLAADARDRGVRRLVAEVLPDNKLMLAVFLDAGFDIARRTDSGVVLVDLDPSATDSFLSAADQRDARSEARSLAPLLHPDSVAVVGARRDGTGVGAAVLRSIRSGGFAGRLSVVHPTAADVSDVPAYPSLTLVPEPVDLAIVTVPAESALAAVRDAARAGVGAVVVISSGFGEMGAAGAALQQEMVHVARAHSMRLVGPNCLGLVVNEPGSRLNATFHETLPPVGGLAVASQSGGVGIVLMDLARQLGLGVNSFVSLGNKADVSSNDLLGAWREDPTVGAVALYLESFGNAVKFARIAREFSEHKPLLAVVGGRSAGGQRAGASHTAASASSAVGVAALFAQAGVIACDGAEDLAETALLVTEQPLPRGLRLGVLSNAGGMGVLAADVADAVGVSVPELSPEVANRLATHVLGTVGTNNPVDAGAGATAHAMAAVAEEMLATDELDALLVVVIATGVSDSTACVRALTRARAAHPDTPVMLVAMGGVEMPPEGTPGLTRFGSIDAAVRALGRVARYRAWRDVARSEPVRSDPSVALRTRASALAMLEADGEGFLRPDQISALLGDYGLAPTGTVALGAEQAALVATETGFPVAVKVADPTVVHKTDRGLVRVGLASAEEVERATREMGAELGVDDVPVLVQPMSQGVELALGLVRDPVFGPLVMVAAGGIATDLWDDRVFLMPPVTARDASRAVRGLRLWPLLDGYRGAPPVDVDAVEDLVLALGRLAREVPEVAELDLNPVLAGPQGAVLVDVKVHLAPATPADGPRQLRRVP